MRTNYCIETTVEVDEDDFELEMTPEQFQEIGHIVFSTDEMNCDIDDARIGQYEWQIDIDYDPCFGDTLDEWFWDEVFHKKSLATILNDNAETKGKWCIARHNEEWLVITEAEHKELFNMLMANHYVVKVEDGVVQDVIAP